jgi:hypothetical protein
MRTIPALLALSLTCIHLSTSALSPGPRDLRELSRNASHILVVQVTAASLVSEGSPFNCGVTYTGRVTQRIKGTSADPRITFGPHIGLVVGRTYVVFLTEAESRFDASYGEYSSVGDTSDSPSQAKCRGVAPALREVGLYGTALEVGPQQFLGASHGIQLSRGKFKIPTDLKGERVPVQGVLAEDTASMPLNVELPVLVQYIHESIASVR